jgi:hypothetical protein
MKQLILTIIRLILILSPVKIHTEISGISLVPEALRQLKNLTVKELSISNLNSAPANGVPLILWLFTCRVPQGMPRNVSAAHSGGICVFMSLLKDLNLPGLDTLGIEVMPGHIQHMRHFYDFISDTEDTFDESEGFLTHYNDAQKSGDEVHISYNLLVEEVEDHRRMSASYKFTSSAGLSRILRPVCIHDCLMKTIRFQRCWPVGLDQHFEIPGMGLRWYVESSAGGKSDQSQDSTARSISGHHWSIVEWTAWQEPVADMQRLDIKIYRPHQDFLLLLLMEVFVKNALDDPSNQYSHVFISEMRDCVNCLVRVAMTRWTQVDDIDGDSAPINHGK